MDGVGVTADTGSHIGPMISETTTARDQGSSRAHSRERSYKASSPEPSQENLSWRGGATEADLGRLGRLQVGVSCGII